MKGIIKKVLTTMGAFCLTAGVLSINAGCGEKTLSGIYSRYFTTGAMVAINLDSTNTLGYEDDVLKQFNSFTAENEMKWVYTENKYGQFTFEKGDHLIEKAKSLGAKVRGHALVWHESCPDYVIEDNDPAKTLFYIQEHVKNTVKHFGHDTVYVWDVVNEAISDSADPNQIYRTGRSDTKKSPMYDIFDPTGKATACPVFIETAFRTARETDSQIKLYYNDYSLINPVKRVKCIKMLQDMIDKDIPIDGVGEQAHYSIRSFDPEQFEQMIIDITSLKKKDGTPLKMSITELDLSIYENDMEDEKELTDELLKLQAQVYSKIYEICRKHSDVIENVTTWGIGDDHTWLTAKAGTGKRVDYPLLYDYFGDPKPCLDAIKDFNYKVKVSDEIKSIDYYNVYEGKNDEFHFGKWYSSDDKQLKIAESESANDGATKISFSKVSDYNEAISSIAGSFSDFKYVNFKLSGSSTVTVNGSEKQTDLSMMAQINYNVDEKTSDKVIGEETFVVSATPTTYTIKLPSEKHCYLDLIDSVWLFPEPGSKNDASSRTFYKGNFYVYDAWFSKNVPAGVKEEDVISPIASASTVRETKLVAGKTNWYNETDWTQYKLSKSTNPDYLVDIKSSQVAEWGYVSVQLSDFKLTDNKLEFTFIDNMNGEKPSLSYIRFRLRGAQIGMFNDGANTYMKYKDKDLIDWINDGHTNEEYVQSVDGGATTVASEVLADGKIKYVITYDITREVQALKNQDAIIFNGDKCDLRLVILCESLGFSREMNKSYSAKYPSDYDALYKTEGKAGTEVPFDKKFNITVCNVRTYGTEAG